MSATMLATRLCCLRARSSVMGESILALCKIDLCGLCTCPRLSCCCRLICDWMRDACHCRLNLRMSLNVCHSVGGRSCLPCDLGVRKVCASCCEHTPTDCEI